MGVANVPARAGTELRSDVGKTAHVARTAAGAARLRSGQGTNTTMIGVTNWPKYQIQNLVFKIF